MATRIEIVNELCETFENEEYLYDETSYDEYQEDEYQEDDFFGVNTIIFDFWESVDINEIKSFEEIMKNLTFEDEEDEKISYDFIKEEYNINAINEKLLTLNDENKVEFIEKIIHTMLG